MLAVGLGTLIFAVYFIGIMAASNGQPLWGMGILDVTSSDPNLIPESSMDGVATTFLWLIIMSAVMVVGGELADSGVKRLKGFGVKGED